MGSLLRGPGYPDIYLLLFSPGNHLDRHLNLLGDTQGAGNIIGGTERQYSQAKAAFGDMGNHPTYQAIAPCCDSYINAMLHPVCSLGREVIQVSYGDAIGDLYC